MIKGFTIEELLELNGFTFKRQNKHPIWTDGVNNFVMSATPGDWRVHEKRIKDLRMIVRRAGREFIAFPPEKKKEIEVQPQHFNAPRVIQAAPKQVEKELDAKAAEFCRSALAEGKRQVWMFEALKAMGYNRGPNNTVFDISKLSRFMIDNGMRMKERAPRKARSETGEEVTTEHSFLHKITDITTSNLSENMKEEMILMLAKEKLGV